MPTSWNNLQSQAIELLRFPMAVSIVMLHYGMTLILDATGPLRMLCIIFQEGICRLAVPCFFLISGYLFFHQLQEWNWSIWKEKLRRRIKTLLIPYILWNIIALVAFWLSDFMQENHYSLYQYFSNHGGLRIFYGTNGNLPLGIRSAPLDDPLWYIRDLMYFIVTAPLFHLIITRTKLLGIAVFVLIFFFFSGIVPEGFLFFLIGAYLQVEKKNILEVCYPKRVFFYTAAILSLVVFYFIIDVNFWGRIIKNIFLFSGIGTIFCLTTTVLKTNSVRTNPFLTQSSFFIFSTHKILILYQIAGPFVQHILPAGRGWACLDFFLTPATAVLICVGLLFIMNMLLPRTTAVLTGSRYVNHAT